MRVRVQAMRRAVREAMRRAAQEQQKRCIDALELQRILSEKWGMRPEDMVKAGIHSTTEAGTSAIVINCIARGQKMPLFSPVGWPLALGAPDEWKQSKEVESFVLVSALAPSLPHP